MKNFLGKRIVLAGGGSGGHITPLLAVGHALKQRGSKVVLMGSFGRGRFGLLTEELGDPIIDIPAGKFRRYFSWQNLLSPISVFWGIVAAGRELRRWKPDLVFAKGGYASFPVIVAAHRLGIPVVIHESDAHMGLANRWSLRLAKRVCVNFLPATFPVAYQSKLVVTGIPINEDFYKLRRQEQQAKRTILVTGGSQGCESINQVIWATQPFLAGYTILHIVGPGQRNRFAEKASAAYEVYDLVAPAKFRELLDRADVVISRGGATSYAEIAAAGRPAIIVPLSHAANNHQLDNAWAWEAAGAIRLLLQSELTSEKLVQAVEEIFEPKTWANMAAATAGLFEPRATEKIIEVISEVMQ
ncbi:MAG: UDP-N-acetylglucosamine--N-acetylmuramyl-(pentapeptide) pyrophosphoryl-undecaprenol N-acetylglucosamine transferase [Patescibacteria group bacterium]